MRAHGRTLRVWHDGLSGARLRRDVVVEWWAEHAGPSPSRLLAQGHRVLNAGWWPTYYDVGPLGQVRPSMKAAYDSWQVNLFGGLAINTPTPASPLQSCPAPRRISAPSCTSGTTTPTAETVAADRPRHRAAAARAGPEDLGHAAARATYDGLPGAVE